MDSRLWNALCQFSQHRIAVFDPEFDSNDGNGSLPATELNPSDPITFSKFCVCLAVHRLDYPVVSYEEAFTEGRRDQGLDGLVVSLDGQALSSPEQAVSLLESLTLEPDTGVVPAIRVLMVQVKREHVTPMREVDFLGSCARRFLREPNFLTLKPNPAITRWWTIYDALRQAYDAKNLPFQPIVEIVFAYAGFWREDVGPEMSREMAERDLQQQLDHTRVRYRIWGVDELVEAIEVARKAVDGRLQDARVVPLPDGHVRGWIGCAPASAIMDLIPEDEERPDDRAFVDNVRAFLGDTGKRAEKRNPGAVALAKTLHNHETDQVLLRHNGITIVARDGEQAPDGSLHLREFQIVNGAQTTFVLHRFRESLNGAWVPVKVVLTEDEQLKDGVILGVNTQAPVNQYDMLARQPEVRALQQSFDSIPWRRPDKIWMQRRRREWIPHQAFESDAYVTPRQLLEAFAAAILAVPHKLHHDPGAFVQLVPNQIFAAEHEPAIYRALGWLVITGRRWAKANGFGWFDHSEAVNGRAYPARHQFIFALWHLVDPYPDQSSLARGQAKVEKRFQAACDQLSGEVGPELGVRAATLVEQAAEGRKLSQPEVRRPEFTSRLENLLTSLE